MPDTPKSMSRFIQLAQKTQPDVQGRGSDESKQRKNTGQKEKRGQPIFVQVENGEHGQEQTGREDSDV